MIKVVHSQAEVDLVGVDKEVVSYDGVFVIYTGSHLGTTPPSLATGDIPQDVPDEVTNG